MDLPAARSEALHDRAGRAGPSEGWGTGQVRAGVRPDAHAVAQRHAETPWFWGAIRCFLDVLSGASDEDEGEDCASPMVEIVHLAQLYGHTLNGELDRNGSHLYSNLRKPAPSPALVMAGRSPGGGGGSGGGSGGGGAPHRGGGSSLSKGRAHPVSPRKRRLWERFPMLHPFNRIIEETPPETPEPLSLLEECEDACIALCNIEKTATNSSSGSLLSESMDGGSTAGKQNMQENMHEHSMQLHEHSHDPCGGFVPEGEGRKGREKGDELAARDALELFF